MKYISGNKHSQMYLVSQIPGFRRPFLNNSLSKKIRVYSRRNSYIKPCFSLRRLHIHRKSLHTQTIKHFVINNFNTIYIHNNNH